MSRPVKIFTAISVLILVSWFVPIIPTYTSEGFGTPGCRLIEFRNLKYFVYDEFMYNPSGKRLNTPNIGIGILFGKPLECSIVN